MDGRGLARLREAGIAVTAGVGEAEARALNRAFFTFVTAKRPHVTLKSAMTLDGKIAAWDGASRWITGEPPARRPIACAFSPTPSWWGSAPCCGTIPS